MDHICHVFAAVAQRPVKIAYRNYCLQFGEALWNIKREDKVGIADCVSLTPAWRGAKPLSLTSGALRPLSQQHLISPLNLGLTRSFGSKGLPLCLQPSSTNGAWRGIEERWRVVARRKNQPRGGGGSGVREAARGLWSIAGVVMWDAHTTQLTVSVALSTFLHHLWLKLMDHPCCWVAYYQFIHQMWWGRFTGPFVAQTLTVLGQSPVHIWGKVSTPGPNKWYSLNGRGNDFYPSSLFWPKGGWSDHPDIPLYNFTPEHYFDLMSLKVTGKGNIKRKNYYKNRDYYQMNIKSMNDLVRLIWPHFALCWHQWETIH